MEDIVGLLVRKNKLPVTFVAKNLSNLPAITFNNIDVHVSTLLGRMEAMRSEFDLMKSAVASCTGSSMRGPTVSCQHNSVS